MIDKQFKRTSTDTLKRLLQEREQYEDYNPAILQELRDEIARRSEPSDKVSVTNRGR